MHKKAMIRFWVDFFTLSDARVYFLYRIYIGYRPGSFQSVQEFVRIMHCLIFSKVAQKIGSDRFQFKHKVSALPPEPRDSK